MPRIARVVVKDYPYHVTQRGNYRQPVFQDNDDYIQYLEWLKEYSQKYSLDIWAYCLMNNHVHFVCMPHKDDSLSRTFNSLHMRYSQYFNRKKEQRGHLWQGRFYSCILDERHVYAAVRYVENNPVRARWVVSAEEYRWSSARSHITREVDNLLSENFYLLEEISNWRQYLKAAEDVGLIENIRKNRLTGRPCGDETFIKQLERNIGRRLIALPHGRPRKHP